MKGLVHSIESFGSVDGPGIRLVVFLQGCPLRCMYCHNPDTWAVGRGSEMDTDEIIERFEKNRHFYTGGGITVSGGEALLQLDFLIDLFKKARKLDIHTCLDTSGITFNTESQYYMSKIDELLEYTSLIMLDIKEIDDERHQKLTGMSNKNILEFATYLSELNIPVWIRHVIVPGYTDRIDGLTRLGTFLGTLDNIKALDVLPYHVMGIPKYRELGITYPLEGVPPATKELAHEASMVILRAIKVERLRRKNEKLQRV